MPSQTNFAFSRTLPAAAADEVLVQWLQSSGDPNLISGPVKSTGGVDARTGTSEAIALAARGKLVTFNNASAVAASLPNAPTMNGVWWCAVKNIGAGLLTLTPTTSTIDSGLTKTVATGTGLLIFSDGTNYFTVPMGAGGGSASPLTTKGDLYVHNATIDTRLAVGVNGQFLTPDSTAATGLAYSDMPERATLTVPSLLTAGKIVGAFVATYAITFGANFAGSRGAILTVAGGANPTSTATFNVFKNGSIVGTMVISTSGVFTFATSGGVAVTYNAGDSFVIVAPGSADPTLAGFTFTFYGTKGLVAQNSIINPAITWQGAYVGATAYSTFNLVRYKGGVYLSIQPTTGNAPTLRSNDAYWNFIMGDGWFNRGAYVNATAYEENDVVANGGSTYLCILATSGNAPPNATYWQVIAQAGSVVGSDVQNQSFVYCVDTGAANAIAVAPSPAFSGYVAGQSLEVKVFANSTTATTINVSSLGTKAVVNADGSALVSGALKAGGVYRMTYNGAAFQLVGAGGGNTTASYILGGSSNAADLTNKIVFPALGVHPDIPPTSANAMDDEFTAGVLDAKWTTRSLVAGQSITSGVGGNFLKLVSPGSIQNRMLGITQPAPAGNWRVRTGRMCLEAPAMDYPGLGMIAYRSGSDKWLMMLVMPHSSHAFNWSICIKLSSSFVYSSEVGLYPFPSQSFYMEMEYDGTNLIWRHSQSGVVFAQCYSEAVATFLGGAPTDIGIGAHPYCNSNSANWGGTWTTDWFRRMA
jgi:hypothetical protein